VARSSTRARMSRLNRNITIAGGGLAGLSLAIALRNRGVPVTVHEAGNYPRHRVCGEFISGVSGETLSVLGILDLFEDAAHHRSLTWYDQGRSFHRDEMPEPALGISRYVLDERLKKRLLSLGGEMTENSRSRPEPEDGLVWAAGRRPQTGSWIGLKAHVRDLSKNSDLEMHSGKNGYAGLAGVEDGWTNVCGLFRIDRSIPAKGADLLPAYLEAGGNVSLAKNLRNAEWREDSFSAVAGFELGPQPVVPGLLCLGDAESMIPPFTGNGMSMAFQAAECAIDPLVAWSSGSTPWEKTRTDIQQSLRRKFRRRLAVAQLLHRALFDSKSRALLQSLGTVRLLPFRPILSLVR
jgi:menaquinone-9 beta-reductase